MSNLFELILKGDAKKGYDVLNPVLTQGDLLRSQSQQASERLFDAGFVKPATLTNRAALKARIQLAAEWVQRSADVDFFTATYVEELNTRLAGIGVSAADRGKLFANHRAWQSAMERSARASTEMATATLNLLIFLADNHGHWVVQDELCRFESPERTREYNQLDERLRLAMTNADALSRAVVAE